MERCETEGYEAMTTAEQINKLQDQIEILRNDQECEAKATWSDVIHRTELERKAWTHGYNFGLAQGKIELLSEQIAK